MRSRVRHRVAREAHAPLIRWPATGAATDLPRRRGPRPGAAPLMETTRAPRCRRAAWATPTRMRPTPQHPPTHPAAIRVDVWPHGARARTPAAAVGKTARARAAPPSRSQRQYPCTCRSRRRTKRAPPRRRQRPSARRTAACRAACAARRAQAAMAPVPQTPARRPPRRGHTTRAARRRRERRRGFASGTRPPAPWSSRRTPCCSANGWECGLAAAAGPAARVRAGRRDWREAALRGRVHRAVRNRGRT